MARLFLDSNVLVDGLVSAWTSSHITLTLCAKKFHQMVTAHYVISEVEMALLRKALRYSPSEAEHLIDDYLTFIDIVSPELVVIEDDAPELRQACIIRHLHDVPVLAAAIKAKPDWLLTLNRKHFTDDIAARTGLRIATPEHFLQQTLRT